MGKAGPLTGTLSKKASFDRICRRYIFEIVNSKDFSKEDKNYLLSGIIVTIYSRQFWKDYILKSEE